MWSEREFAALIDGPSVDARISLLSQSGRADAVEQASCLSRRIFRTVDWEPLGGLDARFQLVDNRGESVLFKDRLDPGKILKLRGRMENGFESTGFGCVLGRDKSGKIELQPGTLAQAIIRESLCWEHFGFGCLVEGVVGNDAGLLLSQKWITPSQNVPPSKIQQMIEKWMLDRCWQPLRDQLDVRVTLRNEAWQKDGIGAFDVQEHNFILSEDDGELYPIDLIVWPMPD